MCVEKAIPIWIGTKYLKGCFSRYCYVQLRYNCKYAIFLGLVQLNS